MKFSLRSFFIVTPLHMSMTVLVALGAFGATMSASPGYNPRGSVDFATAFFWVWQTGPAFCYHVLKVQKIALLLAFPWSILVGIVAGLFFGWRKKAPNQPPEPTSGLTPGRGSS